MRSRLRPLAPTHVDRGVRFVPNVRRSVPRSSRVSARRARAGGPRPTRRPARSSSRRSASRGLATRARASAGRARDGVDAMSSLAARFAGAKAVLWDVDGTLADSTTLGFTSTNAVLVEAGLPAIDLAQYKRGTRFPPPSAWRGTRRARRRTRPARAWARASTSTTCGWWTRAPRVSTPASRISCARFTTAKAARRRCCPTRAARTRARGGRQRRARVFQSHARRRRRAATETQP